MMPQMIRGLAVVLICWCCSWLQADAALRAGILRLVGQVGKFVGGDGAASLSDHVTPSHVLLFLQLSLLLLVVLLVAPMVLQWVLGRRVDTGGQVGAEGGCVGFLNRSILRNAACPAHLSRREGGHGLKGVGRLGVGGHRRQS